MKKRLVGLALTLAIIFSFNAMVVYAQPGFGCVPLEPVSAPICLLETQVYSRIT